MDYNNFFSDLTNDQPFLKMGIQGFSGTGKTFLATSLAIGLWKKMKTDKPIIIFDTEKAFRAIKDRFEAENIPVKVKLSRTLVDLGAAFDAVETGYGSILVVDSISHVWDTFVQQYLDAKNARARKRNPNASLITKLAFGDWGYLKPEWKKRFSDRVVNGSLHIIFTGRAGYTYDHQEDEQTGKMTELKKTGIKMKAESETAYEPDVLVLMERIEKLLDDKKEIWREAIVIKDRYRLIDGKVFKNPTYKHFEAMIDKALDGEVKERKPDTAHDFSELDNESEKWKKKREVAIEELEGVMAQFGLSTGAEDKQIKVDLIDKVFATTSWIKIQNMKVDEIESGVKILREVKQLYIDYCKALAHGAKPDKKMIYVYLEQVLEAYTI